MVLTDISLTGNTKITYKLYLNTGWKADYADTTTTSYSNLASVMTAKVSWLKRYSVYFHMAGMIAET